MRRSPTSRKRRVPTAACVFMVRRSSSWTSSFRGSRGSKSLPGSADSRCSGGCPSSSSVLHRTWIACIGPTNSAPIRTSSNRRISRPWSSWSRGCSGSGERIITAGRKIGPAAVLARRERALTMADHQVLLVGTRDHLPAELPSLIGRESKNRIGTEVTTAVQEAVTRLSEKGYDAVVCWVEREDELAGVIRIRKTHPQLPILVLTTQESPEFQQLARQMGATRVSRCRSEPAAQAELIRLSIQSGELLDELRSQTKRTSANAR